MKKELTDKQIIESLRYKIAVIKSEIVKRQAILEKYNKSLSALGASERDIAVKETFKNMVKEILAFSGSPLKARDIYEEYIIKTGRVISYGSFSGQLSLSVNENKTFIKIELENLPISDRFYYGLPEWGSQKNDEQNLKIRLKK